MKTEEKTGETPIIDVHTHIFSAMDIPIAGYLSSRRLDTSSWKLLEMIKGSLRFVLTEVLGAAVLYPFLANTIREEWARNKLKSDEETRFNLFKRNLVRHIKRLGGMFRNRQSRASAPSSLQTHARKDRVRSRLENRGKMKIPKRLRYALALWAVGVAEGKPYRKWTRILSQDVKAIADEMIRVYGDTGVDLYVPLMIDYEYWFKDSSDVPLDRQIDYIYEHVIKPKKGKIHPFVPFDPARELASILEIHNPDGEHEKGSLYLVKDAIENKGFIGVKVYNTLGYAPYCNKKVNLHRNLALTVNEQTKYLFEGEKYDQVLKELYEYCIENNVPITAHCQMHGIEAYPDASYDFCRPELWKDCLDTPAPGGGKGEKIFDKLRLNLGHFGWTQEQGFLGSGGNWVRQICDMMLEYDHVFADVSHHDVLSIPGRKRAKDSYQRMREHYGDAKMSRIKSRILFGTDWHVLARVNNCEAFKARYVEVLEHKGFCDPAAIRGFLGGNALDFLGLLLPGDNNNRGRLKRFYKKHGIEPPAWFRSLETMVG